VNCEQHGAMSQIWHAETSTTRGWYCPVCRIFIAATGRERLLGINTDTKALTKGYSVTVNPKGDIP
jgi:hypothetical protein